VGSAAGAGLLILAAEATVIYFVVTLLVPIARRRLPLAPAGTSTLLVRYPDEHGILRKVLNEVTQRGFVIDDLATEPADGGHDGDGPPMVTVTMHVHGKRPVSELASALTELDLVDAVVATNPQPADE
jgi:putative Mg2+ transporter-C (MgtC) family protein